MQPKTLYRLPTSGERNTAAGIFVGSTLAIVGSLVLLLWTVTQWAAWKLGFQTGLGTPLFAPGQTEQLWFGALAIVAVGAAIAALAFPRTRPWSFGCLLTAVLAGASWLGPLYAPWDFFRWELRFGHVPGTEAVWQTGHWLIGVPAHFVFVVGIALAVRRARKIGGHTDSHGSARWAKAGDIASTGLVNDAGVYVGAIRRRGKLEPLRHDGPEHVLGFAPSRSGKGVGWVIPTLLSWPHSVLVNDIKGENWALTAGWRQRQLGSKCLRFDPTCEDGSAARYNPLLEVRRGPHEIRDVQNIADILVDPDGDGAKDHWDLTAQEVLSGAILHVLYAGPDKSLRGCLDLLTDPHRAVDEVLNEMLSTKHDPSFERGWVDPKDGKRTATHPAVARAARSLLNKSDNERSSVLSSATKFLTLYHDDLVAANTACSDFCIRDLMHQERPVSLYLTVPPSDLSRTRPLLRLLINQIGRRLTERMEFRNGVPAPSYRHRLLLMLDEFPSLGRLDFFQTQLAYLAGYGIKAYLIAQDLSQLYAAYGRDESIVSNCPIRLAYAPNKIETARLLSDMAGAMTVHKETRTYTGNRLNPVLMHVMASEQESQRPLLAPDEAMRLPDDTSLIFVAGSQPILGTKFRYFRDPALAARARIPAPVQSDRLPGPQPDLWVPSTGGAAGEAAKRPDLESETGKGAPPPSASAGGSEAGSGIVTQSEASNDLHVAILDRAAGDGTAADEPEGNG
ncbi:MAG: type IV secretory system conjugative DNA transfer family protein [bacterium]|nr:type IV secretory system conjugative DNA transfer family protein [bacterium]